MGYNDDNLNSKEFNESERITTTASGFGQLSRVSSSSSSSSTPLLSTSPPSSSYFSTPSSPPLLQTKFKFPPPPRSKKTRHPSSSQSPPSLSSAAPYNQGIRAKLNHLPTVKFKPNGPTRTNNLGPAIEEKRLDNARKMSLSL